MRRHKPVHLPVTHDLLARDAESRAARIAAVIATIADTINNPDLARGATADLDAAYHSTLAEASLHKSRATIHRGDPIVVTRPGKAPIGTTGIAAFISPTGSILLKDPNTAHIKDSPGTWLDPGDVEKPI